MLTRANFRTLVALQLGRRLNKEEARFVHKLRINGRTPSEMAAILLERIRREEEESANA